MFAGSTLASFIISSAEAVTVLTTLSSDLAVTRRSLTSVGFALSLPNSFMIAAVGVRDVSILWKLLLLAITSLAPDPKFASFKRPTKLFCEANFAANPTTSSGVTLEAITALPKASTVALTTRLGVFKECSF